MQTISAQEYDALQTQVKALLQKGMLDNDIADQLGSTSVKRDFIESIIEDIVQETDIKSPFRHLMILGCGLIAIGVIFGMLTYRVTEKIYSAHFMLLCAFIIAGIIAIIRAITLYKN